MNKCRICWKGIGGRYTDKILFCSSCRREVEKAIGYNKLKVDMENMQCEFGFECEECNFWKREVKKLKANVQRYEKEEDRLRKENKNLSECNLNLQKRLDNKEKVNKQLREENAKLKKYYDRDKEELMESCYSLAKENAELKLLLNNNK